MSDSNRVRVSLIEESTPGTTPSGNFLVMPKTGQSLKNIIRYLESQIIRNDANVQGVHRVSVGAGGGLPTELQYMPSGEALHTLMLAAMRSTETAAATAVSSVVATSGVLAGTSIETGVEVGDVVRVRTAGGVLAGYYPVTATGTNQITVGGGVPDFAGYVVQRGARVKNGTTDKHLSIEVARLDAGLYQVFQGCAVGRMGIRIADEQISQLSFDVEGMASLRGGSAYATGSYVDPTSYPSMTATSVPTFRIAGTTYEATDIAIQWDNRVQGRRRVGATGPTSIRRGSHVVTGTVTVYHDAWTEISKYAGGTGSDIVIACEDSSSNGLAISIPEIKWTDGMVETRGRDQDDFARLTFQAELDATQGITCRLQRWAA